VLGFRGGDEKDEIKNKITNRDVAVIRASGNNNYYHYGPGRRIIIICESVVVSRRTHTHVYIPKSLRIIIILLGWSDVVIKDRMFLSLSVCVCVCVCMSHTVSRH